MFYDWRVARGELPVVIEAAPGTRLAGVRQRQRTTSQPADYVCAPGEKWRPLAGQLSALCSI